jgi:hypothetical protein
VRALFFLVNLTTGHLTQIAAMINAGDLAVNVGTVLPLADARVAHEMPSRPAHGPSPTAARPRASAAARCPSRMKDEVFLYFVYRTSSHKPDLT